MQGIIELTYRYLVIGEEIGENETPHLQGYIVYKNARTMSAIKKDIPRAHLEQAKGNSYQNREYCVKDEKFHEFGERPLTPKEKGDDETQRWIDAWNNAKAGTYDDIPRDIMIRNYRTIKQIRKDHQPQMDNLANCCGLWLVGPPGTGKSWHARELHPNAYIKAQNKWWDGYNPDIHDTVILDDLDTGVLGHYLKIWTDKYPFNAETKGGTIFIRPKAIVVTSNFQIQELHDKHQIVSALTRRFTVKELLIKYKT